jgi:hypothetical protein
MISKYVSHIQLIIIMMLTIICSTSFYQICYGENVRTFKISDKPFNHPLYAKFGYSSRITIKGKTQTLDDQNEIWYRDPKHIRYVKQDFPGVGMQTYMIRSGNNVFGTVIVKAGRRSLHWSVTPASWMNQSIMSFTQMEQDWKISDAVLIGQERVNGISVEHWQGHRPHDKKGAINAWVSTDKQYPFMMKYECKSPKITMKWEIEKLRLNEPIPDYYFTPQINPKTGLIAQLGMPFKPLWVLLVLFCILLAAFVYLVYSVAAPMGKLKKTSILFYQALYSSLHII